MQEPLSLLMPLLDGTRDRASLAAAIGAARVDVDAMLGALHRDGFLMG
jgi:hypothetical protein